MAYLDELEPGDEPSDDGPIDWAERNRAQKISAMVDAAPVLLGLDGYADAEKISRRLCAFSDEQWNKLQRAAGYTKTKKTPGEATRDGVIGQFEWRASAAAHLEED